MTILQWYHFRLWKLFRKIQMQHSNWSCLRCSSRQFEAGEIRVSGGFWSRIFDVQNKKYSAVTCDKCGYTEFYKRDASTLGNVFDFFTR